MTTTPAELTMIEQTLSSLFEEVNQHASESHTRIGARLEELGWSDIEAEYPIEATAMLFAAQGRTLSQTEWLNTVVLNELTTALPEPVDAVVLPSPVDGALSFDGGDVLGVVVGPAEGEHGRLAIPVRTATGAISLRVAAIDAISATPLNTFDRSLQWTLVTGPVPDGGADASAQWPLALAAAHRALASELVALAETALALAVEHVTVRVQYGTAIGAMQSPRHLLADASARLEGAKSLLQASWRFGGSVSALTAKSAAGRAHRAVSDAALQVCGAVGLTDEHRLHRYVSRGFQLDALCGSAQQIDTQLAAVLFDADTAQQGLPTAVEWA